MKKKIKDKLLELGYKIDFWYENGRLDAICLGKWVGKDLILQKIYKEEDIAELLLNDFLKNK